jgi:hypothetical protein
MASYVVGECYQTDWLLRLCEMDHHLAPNFLLILIVTLHLLLGLV